jgi:hypothetical protein
MALMLATACTDPYYGDPSSIILPAPTGLTYEVEPVGTGTAPTGLLLRWDNSSDPDLSSWHVYSRATSGSSFEFRGSTTSPSFHDAGAPFLDYYVVAANVNGVEGDPSEVVTIDERLALARPASLSSTTLDGAIALSWSDNAYQGAPTAFSNYRIYTAHYDLDAGVCGTDWSLDGTTVAPEFLSGALTNGVPRCFAVTAVSVEGYESLWSPIKDDTPRPDARNIVIYAHQVQDAGSGFRFWQDLDADGHADDNEIGLVEFLTSFERPVEYGACQEIPHLDSHERLATASGGPRDLDVEDVVRRALELEEHFALDVDRFNQRHSLGTRNWELGTRNYKLGTEYRENHQLLTTNH